MLTIQPQPYFFYNNNEFTDLDFEYLPCGGAAAISEFVGKFKPKASQLVLALFNADDAGEKGVTLVIPYDNRDPKKNRWDIKSFGKARRAKDSWLAFYPKPKGKHGITKFNVEDYFSRRVLTRHVLSFNSLDTLQTKDALKKKLAKDCTSGTLNVKEYKNFRTLFEFIREVKAKDAINLSVNDF